MKPAQPAFLFSLFIFILVPQGLPRSFKGNIIEGVAAGALAAPEVPVLPQVKTYDELLTAIRQAQSASQNRIDQEKVRLAWETGKLIDRHVLQHKERADYAKYVALRLARDLGRSKREIYYMLEFARAYPIVPTSAQLTWSHYRELLALNDELERQRITEQAEKEKWDVDQVRTNVQRLNARRGSKNSQSSETLEATPGKAGTYRIVKATVGEYSGELVVDLGFSNYFKPEKKMKFQDRDIVTLEKGKLKKTEATEEALFTYRAYVLDIMDGDTFSAVVSLGFGFNTVQKLRLRGLDAPEMDTEEGRRAKKYLETILKIGSSVLIKTLKSDKYDRYLADVWVGETYINQKLIDKGLAVKVTE